jgi:Trypsin-co-occurring domain 2
LKVTDSGVPVGSLITAVKQAVKSAGASQSPGSHGLEVASVQLVLQALASKTAGGTLDFRIPFIGMKIRTGAKVTAHDTQTLTITLVPPARPSRTVRSGDVEQTLVDAIATIRKTMAEAAVGDDPWVLSDSVIDISFGITRSGSISIGADGELSGEVTQRLKVTLIDRGQS